MDINENKGELIKKGDLLILQGQEPKYIHYLHSGSLEILSAPSEYDGLNQNIILSKSKKVCIIKEKSLISGLSILFTGPYKKSIKAHEDSYVSKYPIKDGGFRQIAMEDSNLATTIMNHLLKRLEFSISDSSNFTKLYQNICKITDNISLMFKALSETQIFDKLQHKAENLYKLFISNGGGIPTEFDAKFLITDNSTLLKKKYSFPGLPMESLIDKNQCKFLKKLLNLKPNLFLSIIKEDPSISEYMFEKLSDNLITVLNRIESIQNEIDETLSNLFGSTNSWSAYLVDGRGLDEWKRSGRISPDFTKNFISILAKIISYYKQIYEENPLNYYPGLKKINQYYLSEKSPAGKEDKIPPAIEKSLSKSYQNSLQQIFEFALIDKNFQEKFLKGLSDFKKIKNPFNTEPEGRKIRKLLTQLYWDLFKQVFIRKKNDSSPPPPVELMLTFGFLDETLVEENQISELCELLQKTEEKTNIPIYNDEEFLGKIYDGKENPSITEMGLSYEANLREEEKHKNRVKKGLEVEIEDENIKKAMYEIDHRLLNTCAICSGSTATAFPILTSMITKGNPSKYYTSKKKIDSIIETLREIDSSAFYRETVLKLGEAREVIQDEVLPNIILLPSFGTKTMLWQELDGKNRKTPGRIVVPILFAGDILKSIAHTIACFRWELNRTIKGGLWADPIDGGVTGAYFDYVNFYKKNTKLSAETKNKITLKFKSLRTNRDRFAEDYIMWILFEKDGIMRLNNVTREIFYRHVPFNKELRDKLENMPAFSEIATKFKNIHTRTISGYERRYKKYQDENGNLPPALQKFMDFIRT